MTQRYSACVSPHQPFLSRGPGQPSQRLPHIWLMSDARNDAVLEHALGRMPRGSGFIFRHYHLDQAARANRFLTLAALARKRAIAVFLSDTTARALSWGADGTYGPSRMCKGRLPHIATAHDWPEIRAANRSAAAAVMLSPVYPTRSHTDAKPLGPLRFQALARIANMPVFALGGMNAARARRLRCDGWAAIDGLS